MLHFISYDATTRNDESNQISFDKIIIFLRF
jgi:hypothetical protein